MAEYVAKEAIYERLKYNGEPGAMVEPLLRMQRQAVEKLPVADVAPVIHGYWQKKENIMYHGTLNENVSWVSFVCSECKGEVVLEYPYCPHCPAKMDKKSQTEKENNR